ncbi:hypothetical protein BaRGS_00000908 [Batillaria attramentaria]|uniref:non-specific serine/threonine protein kinase n=1 Tax=Batillaria attramentaria TaxID=370345 RepID=A0ABD0M8X8_9CAEN
MFRRRAAQITMDSESYKSLLNKKLSHSNMMNDGRMRDGWPGQLLQQAVLYDNVDFLQCLLEGEELANINSCDACGRTATYTAVSNNSLRCLRLLLEHGGDPNIAAGGRCHNMTPLHLAVLDCKHDAVKMLLQCGAGLVVLDESGQTPLSLARVIGNSTAVTLLEAEQERRNEILKSLSKRLCAACSGNDMEGVKEVLRESGPNKEQVLNMIPDGELPPLCGASQSGSMELVQLLLQNGAAPVCQRGTGLSPIHIACEAGHLPVVQLLLKEFPDLAMARSVEHRLPLHIAAAHPNVEVLQCLLTHKYPENLLQTFEIKPPGCRYKAGFDVNAQDSSGKMPLHIACENAMTDNVQALLQFVIKDSGEESTTDDLASAQDKAIPQPSAEFCSRASTRVSGVQSRDSVLMRGASTHTLRDSSMHSLHSQDSSLGCEHTPSPLEEHGGHFHLHPVVIGVVSSEGLTPLLYAIKSHCLPVVKLLIEYGASASQAAVLKDVTMTPLTFAFEHHDLDIMKLLLEAGAEDAENRVLQGAFMAHDQDVVSLLLQFKAVRDLGRALNKTEMWRLAGYSGGGGTLERTKSGEAELRPKFLASAVAIQWQGLMTLLQVDMDCVAEASRRLNPALKALDDAVALCAITKVDISGNSFQTFPAALLTLPSLVVVNASKNKIAAMPEEDDPLTMSFMCPVLEELHLQQNKLTALPVYIFRFPALKFLDASHNKISELPSEMWLAPSVVTLDLSHNLLVKLPQFSKEWSIPRKISMAKRTSGASLLGTSGFQGRLEGPPSVSASVSSDDLEVNTNVFDFSFDCIEGGLLSPGSSSEVTHNGVVHVNRWSSTIKVVDKDPWKGSGLQAGLKQLKLCRNKFTAFPNNLACCASNLEVLDLSENALDCVGPISDLPPTLTELNLSRCGLKTLLPWRHAVADAGRDLTCLGVCKSSSHGPRYSSLGDSPSSRASPSLVGRESYSSQAMAASCTHRSHSNLLQLEKLNLAYNRLESIVLTRTAESQAINADAQSMISLESEEIQTRLLFPALTDLDLSLPSKLGLLKKLWKLDLELCPLDGAIQDFLQNSRYPVRDILGFLLSVLEESTHYNCMNLMMVGCHKIGKTSLLHRLRKEGRAPTKPTHWRDRVSNEEVKERVRSQTLSTVGIDINELIFDCGSKGVVNFRTWDFGGQREYYATHQYFLSPRSLYLVMWNIIDGERGVEGLQQWLVNIQARAPGAPVIIVGTHVDILRDKATRRNFPPDFEEAMVGMVRKLFINNQEPDKCGLPCIIDTVNISCKTGENVRKLVDLIKHNVFELKHPRSRTVKLLGQKIPRKYLLLQTVVRELALERIQDFKEPVLNKLCVSDRMMEKGYTTFRDVEELEQATRFLHENGVLFHWDDLALRDLYFLDPQWLCDQLAKVVTVREINSFAQRGVMRISNLEFLFRSTTFQPEDVHQYITSLLAKFEVALQFDDEHLLLPSLLPVQHDPSAHHHRADTRIPVRRPSVASEAAAASSRAPKRFESLNKAHATYRARANSGPEELHIGASVFYAGSQLAREAPKPKAFTPPPSSSSNLLLLAVKPCSNPIFSFCRLYFMTYFPSGFWSRLIVRVLADTTLYSVVRNLFRLPRELLEKSPEIRTLVDRDPEWHCWQTGLELFYLGFEMLRVREVTLSLGTDPQQLCDYSQCRFKCSVEREWCYLDMANSRILEITFPTDVLRFHVSTRDGPMLQTLDLANTTMVPRDEQATGKLLVKMVEHIDNLLQDWYPELGELRFHQNCEGRYLVTRIVPCPQCLAKEVNRQRANRREDDSWFFVNPEAPDVYSPLILTPDKDDSDGAGEQSTSGDGEMSGNRLSGSGQNRGIPDGQAFIYNRENSGESSEPVIFSYLVERCMLDVMQGVNTLCPVHGSVSPQHLLDSNGISHPYYIAPDVVFNDLPVDVRITNSDQVEVGLCLGEGNFGKVYEGKLYRKGGPPESVALKILFEAERGRRSTTYQGFQTRLEAACSAYLTARQEVSILEQLSHPNIVPFLGLALQPLSLVLGLAPNGALSSVLKTLHAAGTHLPLFVVRQVLLQVAKSLAYLHSNNIIYRDLKSENVLVWDLPLSHDDPPDALVHIKIADYGISRTVLPTGAKGFGGTAPFIAPEILQHAGKGTYTEKVDIFSLGMFIFELATCRFPFIEMSNPNTLVCQGGRPSLTTQEVERCPTYLLDLLSVCWSQDPADRPSSANVVTMVTSPQFSHLQDILSLGPNVGILCGLSVPSADVHVVDADPVACSVTSSEFYSHVRPSQIWLSSCTEGSNALEIFSFGHKRSTVTDYRTLPLKEMCVTAMCVVDGAVWCADSEGQIHIYDIDTLGLTHQLRLPVKTSVSVLSLHTLPGDKTVLAVTAMSDCGALFLCSRPQLGTVVAEMVAEEFRVFRCYSSTLVQALDRCELWLGQGSGSILVWDVTMQASVDCLYHSMDKMPPSTCCMFLVSAQPPGGALEQPLLWSYNFPGKVVYCWSTEKRCIVERLDCSAIYSTVDTVTMGPSQHMEAGAQVTALNVVDNYLYVGNTRGRIIVADALSMRPLCIFPAHSPRDFYIKCILPVLGREETEFDEKHSSRSHGVVTVGRGYMDLLNTGTDSASKGSNVGAREISQPGPTDGYSHHTFLLSWLSRDWEFY